MARLGRARPQRQLHHVELFVPATGTFTQALNASLSFTSTLSRFTSALLTTALITFVGTLSKAVQRSFATAQLSFIGTLIKTTLVPLSGSLSFLTTISRAITAALSGQLTFTGTLNKALSRALTTAQLTFTGTLSTTFLLVQALAASLSFVGSISKQTQVPLLGRVSFVGSLARAVAAVLSGQISFAGTLNKQLDRALTGLLSFATSLASTRFIAQVLSGALSFVGSMSRETFIPLTGLLTFIGTLTEQTSGLIQQALSATLSFAGTLAKNTNRTLPTSLLTFATSFTKQTQLPLNALLTFITNANVAVIIAAVLSATLAPVGTITKALSHSVSARLSSVGVLLKQAELPFTAQLTSVATLAQLPIKALVGLLTITGAFNSKNIVSNILGTAKLALKTIFNAVHHGQITNLVTWFGSLAPSRWTTKLGQSRWSAVEATSRWTSKLGQSRWSPVEVSHRWLTGLQWYGGLIATVTQSSLSLEYIEVPIVAIMGGSVYNPTGDTLQFAFMPNPPGSNPSSGNWVNGVWSIAGTAYTAQCLVGPGSSSALTAGTYDIWVKITDSPEVPVRKVGTLVID